MVIIGVIPRSGYTAEVTAVLIEAGAVLILQTLSTLSVATVSPPTSQHVYRSGQC